MTQRIAFFPGVYETVYKSQVDFANKVRKQFGFDKVVFVFHNKEPYVDKQKLPSVQARFQTVNKAIQPYKNLDSLGIEFKNTNPSVHLYHLTKFLKETFKVDRVNILMGSERLKSKFYKWDKIHQYADFFVIPTVDYYKQKSMNVVERNRMISAYYGLHNSFSSLFVKPDANKIVAKTIDESTGALTNNQAIPNIGTEVIRNSVPWQKAVSVKPFINPKRDYYKDMPKAEKFYVRNTDVVV